MGKETIRNEIKSLLEFKKDLSSINLPVMTSRHGDAYYTDLCFSLENFYQRIDSYMEGLCEEIGIACRYDDEGLHVNIEDLNG